LVPATASAEDVEALRGKLFLKILTYDSAFPSASSTVRVGFVYPARASADAPVVATRAMLSMLASTTSIKGKPIQIVELPFTEATGLAAQAAANGVFVFYVSSACTQEEVGLVAEATVTGQIVAFSEDPRHVPLGLCCAVDVKAGRPEIQMNPEAIKRTGHKFDNALIALSKIIK